MPLTGEALHTVKKLRRICGERGLELIECGNGHYQIKGKYLVNYYPFAKTQSIYVAGTIGAIKRCNVDKAIAIATGSNFKIDAPPAERKSSYKKKRMNLWKNGVRECYWCKVAFVSFDEATLEHIIPLSRGGLDNPNNYALTHKKCNHDRGNLLPHKQLPHSAGDNRE